MAKPLFNANIQEYAGYTPPNQIDFNKIFDEAEKDIGGVIKARELERAKNEEFASETEKALTDFSTNVNQDFSTFVGEGLNNYRNLNLQYYKQLKNNEIDSTTGGPIIANFVAENHPHLSIFDLEGNGLDDNKFLLLWMR